jgi:predicted enzyme related to lactoylglutathione lyase
VHGICHVEIATTDIEASKTHLGGLFGWEFRPMDENYCLFKPEDGPGGGLEKVVEPRTDNAIQIYIHVESIDDCLSKTEGLGGRVEKPKTEIGGNHGFYAHLLDPGGTVIGIWEAQS